MTDEMDKVQDEMLCAEAAEEDVAEAAVEAAGAEVGDDAEECAEAPEAMNEAEGLRLEVERLRGELVRRERMDAEWQEFATLYPDVNATAVPDAVWESVGSGIPLAAAYALHERRRFCRERHAEDVNRENARRSSGSMRTVAQEEFYSPEEVRAMGAGEVRAKYGRILESMKRWG